MGKCTVSAGFPHLSFNSDGLESFRGRMWGALIPSLEDDPSGNTVTMLRGQFLLLRIFPTVRTRICPQEFKTEVEAF